MRHTLAVAILVAFAGCASIPRLVEEGGRKYTETEWTVFGRRVWLSREPVMSPRERAFEDMRGPMRWLNRIAAIVGVVGFAAALALKQYGLQWAGRIAAIAGGAAWGATASVLWALSWPWWVWCVAASGVFAVFYFSRNHGLDQWIGGMLRNRREKASNLAAEPPEGGEGGIGSQNPPTP